MLKHLEDEKVAGREINPAFAGSTAMGEESISMDGSKFSEGCFDDVTNTFKSVEVWNAEVQRMTSHGERICTTSVLKYQM